MEQHNAMGKASIPGLILKMSLPMMLSLATNSLFFLVDSIFVSHLNEQALTALSLATPVTGISTALGTGVAIGFNAAVSKALGERDEEKTRNSVSAAFFLALCSWGILALIGLFGSRAYFEWQSGGDPVVAAYGESYPRIYMLLSVGQMFQWVLDRCLISAGHSTLFLFSLAFASLVNLVLDPILIFGLLGFPALGTAGSAIATVAGQTSGALFCAWLNRRWNRSIRLKISLHIRWDRVKEILRVGVPTTLMLTAVSVSGILLNLILTGFSSTAVAVYGACGKIQGVALIPVNGITMSLVPIAAYNYGARCRERAEQTVRWSVIESILFMGAMLTVLMIFPRQILSMFNASENMLGLGIPALRMMGLGYFVSVYCLVASSAFQAFGKGNYSMVLTTLRQAVLPLLLVVLLSRTGNLTLLWLAFPLAELVAVPCAMALLRRLKREVISKIA